MEMADINIKVEEGMMGHIGMGRPPKPPSQRRGRGTGTIRNMLQNRIPQPEPPLPLEEAAKRELQAMPSKTPVSVLQELLSRRGTTPKYELVQVEGAIHEPTFRYTVSVGEVPGMNRFAAMGTGRSKKEAKHAAAKAILDKITGNESNDLGSSNNITENIASSMGAVEDRMIGNPIGLLQELCMTRRWPPPAYETESEEGLPHERQFTISCLVFRHKEVGTGKSKKIAKRLAAHKMWIRLKDLPCENNSMNFGLDDDDENMILSKDSDFNPVRFLQEIAAEQQFEVTFVGVEEKSVSGKYQSLVQLSTLPVAVCYGTGATSNEAQISAAFNALQYLKLLIVNK